MKRVLFYILSAFLTLGGSTLAMAKQISHTKVPQQVAAQHHQQAILVAEREDDDEFPPGVAAGLEGREEDDHGEGEGHE